MAGIAAAENGHLDVLRYLHEAGGRELIMQVDKDGRSCAHVAAKNGHSHILRYLSEAVGREVRSREIGR